MSKAVMLSIRPKWVEKIASGEKTIEVRKTRPKLQTPFKCYIYCTMDHPYISVSCAELDKLNYRTNTVGRCNGKVIGEFTCERIAPITYDGGRLWCPTNAAFSPATCLSQAEIIAYIGDKGRCYGWHISDLRIYDTPKTKWSGFTKIEAMTPLRTQSIPSKKSLVRPPDFSPPPSCFPPPNLAFYERFYERRKTHIHFQRL
jgi:predicted transcriptional regulator